MTRHNSTAHSNTDSQHNNTRSPSNNYESSHNGDSLHNRGTPLIHKGTPSNLRQIIDTLDLIQHVTNPAHKLGNTLDIIITKNDIKLLNLKVDELLSDHNVLIMKINILKPP